MTDKLPPATLRSLVALWNEPEMRAYYADFRKMTGVKSRAYHPFIRRLEDTNLIDREWNYVALTLKGMLALRAHFTALYADRPCEAYRLETEKYARVPDRKPVAATV